MQAFDWYQNRQPWPA